MSRSFGIVKEVSGVTKEVAKQEMKPVLTINRKYVKFMKIGYAKCCKMKDEDLRKSDHERIWKNGNLQQCFQKHR